MSYTNVKDGSGFEAKSIVSIEARNGYFTKANIFYNGKKIASYLDEGNGGEVYVNFVAVKYLMHRELVEKYLNLILPFYEEGADSDEFSKKFPFLSFSDSSQLTILFESIIIKAINDKRFKRLCKTSVLFRLKGDKVETYRNVKLGGHPVKAVIDFLNNKYKAEMEEVLNLRFL